MEEYIIEIYSHTEETVRTAQITIFASSLEMAYAIADAWFGNTDLSYVVL